MRSSLRQLLFPPRPCLAGSLVGSRLTRQATSTPHRSTSEPRFAKGSPRQVLTVATSRDAYWRFLDVRKSVPSRHPRPPLIPGRRERRTAPTRLHLSI